MLTMRATGNSECSTIAMRPRYLIAYVRLVGVVAVEEIFGRNNIDFGMMVKPNTTDSAFDDIRPTKKAIFGEPKEIGTSFVERSNLTLRMGNRRFNRETNAHSKSLGITSTHSLCFTLTTTGADRICR